MALLEGPPVIAEELREGVFVDPLPGGCHSARLYHGLAPRSTRLCPSSAPLSPSSLPIATGGEGILKKRKFLYAPGSAARRRLWAAGPRPGSHARDRRS